MKGLANLQCESMRETPRQQVEQLLRDDGFLKLRSVRAEDLFLERTLIALQTFWKLICAFSKAWGQFIFGRCLYKRVNHSGICWVCALHAGGIHRELREGLIVRLSFFPARALCVLQHSQNKHQRTSKPCFGFILFGWLVVFFLLLFVWGFFGVLFVWFWVCCCCLILFCCFGFVFKENKTVLQEIQFLTTVLSAGGDTGF